MEMDYNFQEKKKLPLFFIFFQFFFKKKKKEKKNETQPPTQTTQWLSDHPLGWSASHIGRRGWSHHPQSN
jgi:hypothetical protein